MKKVELLVCCLSVGPCDSMQISCKYSNDPREVFASTAYIWAFRAAQS
jgi:hypothetical protein